MRRYSLIAAVILGLVAPAAHAEEGTRFRPAITSSRGVVASISDLASKVGIDVLDRGGNAIDAAVAMVFAVGVVRPDMGGIGGSGVLLHRSADGKAAALDFREVSSSDEEFDADVLSGEGMHKDSDGCGTPGLASGHRVPGVPGVVAGMEAALDRFGSGNFGLGDLITNGGATGRPPYAYELARDGFVPSPEMEIWLTCEQSRFQYYPATREIYGAGSGWNYPGELVQADYAESLLLIANHGADAFYADAEFPDPVTGLPRDSIARMIAADMAGAEEAAKTNPVLLANEQRWNGPSNDKGFLTVEDFEEYEAVWRAPLRSAYRGHRVITVPPPSSGGVGIIEILNLVEGFPLGSTDLDTSLEENRDTSWDQSSANHLHVLAEAQKIAWADRNEYLADPDFRYDFNGDGESEPVPARWLASKEYAETRRGEIDETGQVSFTYEPGPYEGSHTNHLSVIDEDGNAVSVTTSVGNPFGSAVVAPGTGFVLSDQLSDFTTTWPEDEPIPANAPAPGKRPRTNAAPTILLRDVEPVLVVGGAGGPTIPLGITQMIVNVVDFGLDIAQTIDAERIEARAWGDFLNIEAGEGSANQRVPNAVLAELRSRGHRLRQSNIHYSRFPVIEAVGFNLVTGLHEAISDPRNEVSGYDPSGNTFGQGACGQDVGCRQQG
jgi:gamma-glutamyltranspeptidase/glutathione hydrolase